MLAISIRAKDRTAMCLTQEESHHLSAQGKDRSDVVSEVVMHQRSLTNMTYKTKIKRIKKIL